MDKEKYVDESWKEQAVEEKDKLAETAEQGTPAVEAQQQTTEASSTDTCGCGHDHDHDQGHDHDLEINFLNYITSLGFQAMIFMGDIPNPVTNEVEKNLTQAKFLIDTLAMLKEKTAGNLDEQEQNLLQSSLYELQLRYVDRSKESSSQGEKTVL